ncbi:MAG: electron transport complex subunit E [Spirochaetaceae bacterium]|nr:electron transport complex subunit E [Spirochaetaceae bacterium]
MKSKLHIFTAGIIRENPLLVLMIGLCSSLGITTSVFSGIAMGISMTFVLLMSELIISIFRNIIPNDVRIPTFIIVIAAFTTIVQLVIQAYLPDLYASIGLFIALIVVNCIIMGRVEAFSSKQPPINALFDGLGMGIGYTIVLVLISAIREVLGNGAFWGIEFIPETYRIGFFVTPPGGFFVFGLLIAVNAGLKRILEKKPQTAY